MAFFAFRAVSKNPQ